MQTVESMGLPALNARTRRGWFAERSKCMGLIRTAVGFVIVVILFHVGMSYLNVKPDTNGLTSALYSLGGLLESPAEALIKALPLSPEQRSNYDTSGFYFTAFAAAAGYFVIFLLLGVGRR